MSNIIVRELEKFDSKYPTQEEGLDKVVIEWGVRPRVGGYRRNARIQAGHFVAACVIAEPRRPGTSWDSA